MWREPQAVWRTPAETLSAAALTASLACSPTFSSRVFCASAMRPGWRASTRPAAACIARFSVWPSAKVPASCGDFVFRGGAPVTCDAGARVATPDYAGKEMDVVRDSPGVGADVATGREEGRTLPSISTLFWRPVLNIRQCAQLVYIQH